MRRSISARQVPDFDPANVVVTGCNVAPGEVTKGQGSSIGGYVTWRNDHQATSGPELKAYIRAGILVGGETVPLSFIDTDHQYRRRYDDTAFELMVAEGGATHNVEFEADVADLPTGQNMAVEVDPLVIEERTLDQF